MSWMHGIEQLILPPGLTIVLLLMAGILYRRYRKTAWGLALSGLLALYLFSTPIIARALMSQLETFPALNLTTLQAQPERAALVILGAGRYVKAPEYGERDDISALGLQRLRYGSKLAAQLEIPILLSGGRRNGESTAESVLMNQVAVDELQLTPSYLEVKSRNTFEAAINIAEQLKDKPIDTLFVVTHAWHMPRAVYLLRQRGFAVVPAPMGFVTTEPLTLSLLPSARALMLSQRAVHEMLSLTFSQILISLE